MLGISNRPLFKVASQIALTHHEKNMMEQDIQIV